MAVMETLLHQIVDAAIILFEFMGVIVLILAGVRGICDFLTKNPKIRLNLANGMALGLEFKLGSEILRTVIVRENSEIITVAGIIALRAALTFLIHWEIKVEEASENLKENEKERQREAERFDELIQHEEEEQHENSNGK